METLLVQLDPNRESARWLVLDEKGQPHAAMRSGGLDQLKDFSQQRRVVCLLEGSNVFLDQVVLPAGRNRRKLIQAIPFAMEDDLAEDLDNLHFALGREQAVTAANDEDAEESATKQINVPVAIIARERLSDWLETLAQAGIKPHGLFPDLLSLPLSDDQWHVLIHGDKAAIRTGPQSGFSCDRVNLEIMLDTALEQSEKVPAQIQIWNHNEDEIELTLQHEDVELLITNTDQAPLSTLARGFSKENQINLLQGEFSYREEYGKLFKNWITPAVLFGVWILIAVIAKTAAYFQLKSESDRLEVEIIETYKKVFPNSKNFTNPRQQLKTALDNLGGGKDSPLLQLLSAAAMQTASIPDAHLKSLDFNGEALDVEIDAKEVQQLEQMRQQLQSQGFSAEIKSANTEGDRVTGELRLGLQ